MDRSNHADRYVLVTSDAHAGAAMADYKPYLHARWDAGCHKATQLWREIHAWAKRQLDEVHTLASAYGWSEADILAMSASRRRRYVSLVAGAG